MTVLELIRRSSEYLEKRGVESPRLQIELLLAHVLKLPRLKLYLDFERSLSERELDAVRTLVKRRAAREPLQYITGVTCFCGIELEVGPAVLIPRPETELLVEQAWNFLGRSGNPAPRMLDFGTGSGCIAIAVAAKFPRVYVAAIDISESALLVARANAQRNKTQVEFHCGGDFAPGGQQPFDLIVSNPPYIPTNEVSSLQPEVRDHEPRVALDGGADGLELHRLIARESPSCLADGGKLMVELGYGQAQAAGEVYVKEGWGVESVLPDYSGCARILIAHR